MDRPAGGGCRTLPAGWREILPPNEAWGHPSDCGSESGSTRAAPRPGAGRRQVGANHSALPDEAGTQTDHRQPFGTSPGVMVWSDSTWPSVNIDIESPVGPLLDPIGPNLHTGTRSGVADGIGSRGQTGFQRIPFGTVEHQELNRIRTGCLYGDARSPRTSDPDSDSPSRDYHLSRIKELYERFSSNTERPDLIESGLAVSPVIRTRPGDWDLGHHGPQPYPSSVRSVGTQTDRSMELREQSLIKPMSSCDKLQVSDSLLVCEIEADQAVERRRTIPLVPFAVDTVSSECHGQDPGKRVERATVHQQSNVLFGGLQPSLSERDRSSESPSVDSMRSDCPSRQDSAGSDGERGLPSRPANEPTADLKILMKEYNRLQSEKLDQLNGILREFCTLVPAEDSL